MTKPEGDQASPDVVDARGKTEGSAKARAPAWKKGQSGNPKGRPRIPAGAAIIVDKLRNLTPEAVKALEWGVKQTKNRDHQRRCAEAILTMSFGKNIGDKVPLSDGHELNAATMVKLEQRLVALALDGDRVALFAALKAGDPARWGGVVPEGGDGEAGEPEINLVPKGEGRKEHLVVEQAEDAEG